MEKLIEISKRQGQEDILKKYLMNFYDNKPVIDKEPTWDKCFNITDDPEKSDAVINNAAGWCSHKNLIPLEMCKYQDTIYIRTN